MKTKLLLIPVVFLFFLAISSQAQTAPAIQIDWIKKEVLINQSIITKKSTLDQIRKALGPESRKLEEANNPAKLYIYDSLGLNFVIDTVAGVLRKMDIYCSKGRGEFTTSPRNLFTGRFMMDQQTIAINDNIESVKRKTKLPFEPMGGLPWFTADHDEFSMTIAYTNKDQDLIRAIHILLDPEKD